MAIKVPSCLMQLVEDVPERYFAEAFRFLRINEMSVFKKFCAKKGSKEVCKNFLLSTFGADKAAVQLMYAKIENILFVGGCAPGVGIAFNLIDACFCFILGNWLGLIVAILSCFPIPGFKVAGKGLEKFLTIAIKRIPIGKISSDFIKLIGKRVCLLKNIVVKDPYKAIADSVRNLVTEVNNPFAQEIIKELSKAIGHFGPKLEAKTISNYTHMTISPSLLEVMKTKAGNIL